MIASDDFREYLRSRNAEVSTYVHASKMLRDKVHGVAHLAVERLAEAVIASDNPDFALAAADKMLGRLGMGAGRGSSPVVLNNFAGNVTTNVVSAEILEQARGAFYRLAQGSSNGVLPTPVIEGEVEGQ
jgi:hypothetical protein